MTTSRGEGRSVNGATASLRASADRGRPRALCRQLLRGLLAAGLALLLAPPALAQSRPSAAPEARTLRTSLRGRYEAESRYPQFAARTPLVRMANRVIADWVRADQRDFAQEARKQYAEGVKPLLMPTYRLTYRVAHYDPQRLISLVLERDQFMGGAHGLVTVKTLNFGIVQAKSTRLKLSHFFQSGSRFRKALSDQVIRKLKAREGAMWVHNGEVKELNPQQLSRFSVDARGLTFYLDPYEVGPYAAGSFQVLLTPAELGPAFKRSLLPLAARGSRSTRQPNRRSSR